MMNVRDPALDVLSRVVELVIRAWSCEARSKFGDVEESFNPDSASHF